jgi:hypothetical protein
VEGVETGKEKREEDGGGAPGGGRGRGLPVAVGEGAPGRRGHCGGVRPDVYGGGSGGGKE